MLNGMPVKTSPINVAGYSTRLRENKGSHHPQSEPAWCCSIGSRHIHSASTRLTTLIN
jgi:hypothetical protein